MKHTLFAILFLLASLLPGQPALAQADFVGQIGSTGTALYGPQAENQRLGVVVGRILRALLAVSGIILLVIMIYAGVLWMTAGGNTDQVKKAKGLLINAVIGLLILVLAFSATQFVLQSLVETAQTGT